MGLLREQHILLALLEWCAVLYCTPPDPQTASALRRKLAYYFYCLRLVLVLAWLPTLTYFRVHDILEYVNIQTVSYIMWLMAVIVETVVIVMVLLANFINVTHFGALTGLLDRVERSIEARYTGTSGAVYPAYGLGIVALMLLGGTYHLFVSMNSFGMEITPILKLRLEVLVFDFYSIQVTFLLLAVGRCATHLRRMLQAAIDGNHVSDVCTVLRLRDDLVRIVALINRCYGTFFFGSGVSWLVAMTSVLYFDFVLGGVFVVGKQILSVHVLMLVWKSICTGGLLMVAGLVTERLKETTHVTERFESPQLASNRLLLKMVEKALLKCQFQDFRFTVYEFFPIDNSLSYTVICSIVTYLVILVQFRQLEEQHENI